MILILPNRSNPLELIKSGHVKVFITLLKGRQISQQLISNSNLFAISGTYILVSEPVFFCFAQTAKVKCFDSVILYKFWFCLGELFFSTKSNHCFSFLCQKWFFRWILFGSEVIVIFLRFRLTFDQFESIVDQLKSTLIQFWVFRPF